MLAVLRNLGPLVATIARGEERNLARLRTVSEAAAREGHECRLVGDVLDYELARGRHKQGQGSDGTGASLGKPSAALALLWTRRTLHMAVRMLENLHHLAVARRDCGKDGGGGNPFVEALGDAYAQVLRPYHSWLLQGTFSTAINPLTLPPYDQLLTLLAPSPSLSPEEREALVLAEMLPYCEAGAELVNELASLFAERALEDTSRV